MSEDDYIDVATQAIPTIDRNVLRFVGLLLLHKFLSVAKFVCIFAVYHLFTTTCNSARKSLLFFYLSLFSSLSSIPRPDDEGSGFPKEDLVNKPYLEEIATFNYFASFIFCHGSISQSFLPWFIFLTCFYGIKVKKIRKIGHSQP